MEATEPVSAASMVDTLLDLRVGQPAHGGWCVARHEGRVVFVRHALPDERVSARVTEETSRFLRADAVEVLEASPERVEPPCPFAGPGRCGGCDWQHASLPAQRRIKAAVVEEQLRRLAGVERPVTVEEVPGAPDGLGWRTRMRFAVGRDGVAGLHRHRSHEIEPIDACLIAHPDVEELGVETSRWPATSSVEAAAAADSGDRALTVTPRGNPHRLPRLPVPPDVSLLRADPRGRMRRVRGQPGVREYAAGRSWRVSAGAFWQVHVGAADALAAAVVEALGPRTGEAVLDLYCGVGLFAGVLADRVGPQGSVLGVESGSAAADDATYNLNDLPQVRIERGRAGDVLDQWGEDRLELAVADPPRAGLGRDMVARLCRLVGRAVAYVSCDPATLARDVAYFHEHGWELAELRAFDAFPMTHHVECLAVLVPGEDAAG